MKIPLDPALERFVEQKVNSGEYASPKAVVEAGLEALKREECFGDFAAGELDALLRDGEENSPKTGSLKPAESLDARRARRLLTPDLGG